MQRIAPAVVYLGPTLPRETVAAELPGTDIRPPVRRGDLYRDRMLRYSLFILIDGAFFQNEALSLREVIDVLEDGAVVLGAASMGALRAAELWPVGMQGVGIIYRLFRRGVLVADDEVAVVFDAERPHPPLSVALVDVRWSLRRAVRRHALRHDEGEALLARARALPYAERSWAAIAGRTLPPDRLAALARQSLKARDAHALLKRVRALVQKDPGVLHRQRQSTVPFKTMDATREAVHDPLAWLQRSGGPDRMRRWLLATGRAAQAAGTERPDDALGKNMEPVRIPAPEGVRRSDERSLKWHGATVMRFLAHSEALQAARALNLEPEARHRLLAEAELVRAHGAADWASLLAEPPVAPDLVLETRRDLALVKAWRERLFAGKPASEPSSGGGP